MPKLSLETLNEDRIRKAVDRKIFELGQNLFQQGRVQVRDIKDQVAQCVVQDKRPFDVEIKVANNYLYLKCACRYAYRGTVCEHEVAACLAVREVLRQRQPAKWRAQLNRLIDTWQTIPRRKAAVPYLLFFSLQDTSAAGLKSWKIVPYQLPLSALPKELRGSETGFNEDSLAKITETTPGLIAQIKTPYHELDAAGCLNCSYEGVRIANILIERVRAHLYYFNLEFPLEDFLTLIASTQSPIYLGEPDNPLQRALRILVQPGELRLNLTRDSDGLHIHARINLPDRTIDLKSNDRPGSIRVIQYSPLWLLIGQNLIKLGDSVKAEIVNGFLEYPEILIPTKDEGEFLRKHYLPLAEQVPLEGDLVSWETVEEKPIKRVYLSETDGNIQGQLRFCYGSYEVPYDPHGSTETLLRQPNTWTLVRIRRQSGAETSAMEALTSTAYGLKRNPTANQPGVVQLRARLHPIDFLLHHVPRLAQDGYEVFGEERIKTARVNRNTPTISIQVSSGIDWFDVKAEVSFGDLEVSLKDIRRAIRKKERYIKLTDGTIGEIPEEWLEKYKHLFGLGEETQEGVRLSRHHQTLLDQALDNTESVQADAEYYRRREELRNFSGITPRPLPSGFVGELRPYQKAGFDWLHFLHEYHFGGCLADDMGLGKTIQALVFFQSLREGGGGNGAYAPSAQEQATTPCSSANLLVVPRSLLINWQREAARFTPNLRILEYFDSDRPKDFSSFDRADIVITTYGIMLRDIHLLCRYRFNYILLDESQSIKNPLSQTARAARLLQGAHRLVLTGTPVENSTVELWSQFAFLNPGLLGNLEYFKEEFGAPIERRNDEVSAQLLRKLVYPFILRRTKDQVAPELPPRSERILYCDMEPAQRKLYLRTRDYYRGLLLGLFEKEGLGHSRLKILEGLLRLRQISIHPRLMDEKFRGESGKFELLLETLETLQSEGHKALVFSQFVSMLRIVRHSLDERKIPYAYLDGRTKNRQEQVDAFQTNSELPFFLISLRAGGLGLNLTAADYVIHIDPWWNPAVEAQATDRTHRIGQDKPVFIYKLITRDSVEEKILLLQERKKNLVDQLISTDTDFFKDLSTDDVMVLFS